MTPYATLYDRLGGRVAGSAAAWPGPSGSCAYCTGVLRPSHVADRPPWDTVLWETDDAVVVPTIGAIVPGWLLVVTKEHVPCMGALCEGALKRLETLLSDLVERVRVSWGVRPTLFEHGPAGPGRALGCTIDHAHLHLVPIDFSLIEAAEAYDPFPFLGEPTEGLSSLRALYGSRLDYLYVKEPDGRELALAPADAPCQYFRRVIARAIGLPDAFDWRLNPHVGNIAQTLAGWVPA